MGCAGNQEIRTPNLDRLAKEGVRFDHFFCASPVCSPARASILTGRIPSQHGVIDWLRGGNLDAAKLNPDIKDAPHFHSEHRTIQYLEGQIAYTDILSQHGYVCGLSGKWHLGDSVTPQKGFSHWFTIARGGCEYPRPDVVRNGEVVFENRYITDLITEDALAFLDNHALEESPFYLSVHYTAPHAPWEREQHPEHIYRLYEDCPFLSAPEEPVHPSQSPTAPLGEGERRKELLRGYYTAVTAMDQGVGQIIEKLEQLNIRQDTLLVFMSDNGMNMGHHGIWGKGNGTFPLNMFDTSVKVPALFSQPGRIEANRVCDDLLSQYDVFPTLLDYLQLENPEADSLPGKSFAPLLLGSGLPQHDSVVVYDEYGPVRMVRTREWKYVHRYPYGPHELYHLANDPDERLNLLEDERTQEIQVQMRAILQEWIAKYVDPMFDGVRESVTGFGQIDWAGPRGGGRQAFCGRE
jgi:choline-sulfatase